MGDKLLLPGSERAQRQQERALCCWLHAPWAQQGCSLLPVTAARWPDPGGAVASACSLTTPVPFFSMLAAPKEKCK